MQDKRFVANKEWVRRHDGWLCIDKSYGLDAWDHKDEWKGNKFDEYCGHVAVIGCAPLLLQHRSHHGGKTLTC